MSTTDKPSQEFWLKHIKCWQSSKISQADYCKRNKIIVHRFGYWKRKLIPLDAVPSKNPSPGFARVNVVPTVQQNTGLSLHLPNGFSLQGINANNLTIVNQLLEVLR